MRMSEAELATEPVAGNLFALETDVQGLPEPRFAGG
jgi:sugar lactone lactonase YvrE